ARPTTAHLLMHASHHIAFLHFLLTMPATPDLSTLSLHDALPISSAGLRWGRCLSLGRLTSVNRHGLREQLRVGDHDHVSFVALRSEEHTSELQSPYDLVCRLLLEKKKRGDNRGLQHQSRLLSEPA